MLLNDLVSQVARYLRMTNQSDVTKMCGLAEGTNAATLKTTRSIDYFLYNADYTFAATDNIAMTACAAQAVSTFCYYLVSIDSSAIASGVKVTKGTDNALALPVCPAGTVAIGAFKVITDGTHTFTSGTTDLSAAGITASFYDIDTGVVVNAINQAIRRIESGVIVKLNDRTIRFSDFDHMKVRTTVALAAGDYFISNPVPGYKDLINAHIIDSGGQHWPELERMEYNEAILAYPNMTADLGRPIMISRVPVAEGSLSPDITPTLDILLRPSCDTDYTLDITAYQYSPTLDGVIYTSNWWTNNRPEIALYGALVELAPYFKEDERISTWRTELDDAVAGLVLNQLNERVSGSKLNIRNPLAWDKGYFDYNDVRSGNYF